MLIPTGHVGPYSRPETLGTAKVSTQRVPRQSRVLDPQCCEAGGGRTASLILRQRVRLLDPPKLTLRADLVIDAERDLAIQICCTLTPAVPFPREGVLPWRV